MSALAARQAGALARRSLAATRREPIAWFPAVFFPLLLLAIFTGSFGGAPGNIPGFPAIRGFLDFAIAGAVLQCVLIIGTTSGSAFARDIEDGFFDRLLVSPISRVSILAGHLVGWVVLATGLGAAFLGIGLVFGARVHEGLLGALVVLAFAAVLAVAVGGLGVYLALRTGSSEAVQGTFPLFFALMFFSSAFFPRETMSGWFRSVADVNPISYVVEGMRGQIVDGLDGTAAVAGLGIAVGLAALALGFCGLALRRHLRGSS